MLSHNIVIEKEIPSYQGFNKQIQNKVTNQKELNEYYENRPWLKQGQFITFARAGFHIDSKVQVNYIVRCEHDFQVLTAENRLGYTWPACVFAIGCQFQQRGDTPGNFGPNWTRWESCNDSRALTNNELSLLVDDKLQNHISTWIRENIKPIDEARSKAY